MLLTNLSLCFVLQSLTFDGGMKFNTQQIPNSRESDQVVVNAERYRLCVCTETGRMYRVKLVNDMVTCAIARENPCP